ncbi:MAG TPA: phospholipase D-like domain-containing protein, partial [Bdellovibrionota bacterium]|nr:phospholipase D-like domain-containing protein [Bdellovibrionota bacterium]
MKSPLRRSLVLIALLSSSAFAAPTAAPYQPQCTPNEDFCVMFSPTDMPVIGVGKYLQSATKTIRIATYNISVDEYLPILRKKLHDGVKVELMVDYLQSQGGKVFEALAPAPGLTKVRLPVFRGGTPQMHNKIIVIDGDTILMGSANFTYSGLVANYENVVAIRNAPAAAKIVNTELDELRDVAKAACGIMQGTDAGCTDGANMDVKAPEFHTLLTEGKFADATTQSLEASLKDCSGKDLKLEYGVLTSRNQALLSQDLVDKCLAGLPSSDAGSTLGKLLKLWKTIPPMEHLATGVAAAQAPEAMKTLETRMRQIFVKDPKDGPITYPSLDDLQGLRADLDAADLEKGGALRVYFGPEDGLEAAVLREMLRSLDAPKDSFVYVSTNFITNPRYAKAMVALSRAGVRIRAFFDRGRYEDPQFQTAIGVLRPLGFMEPGQSVFDTTDNRVISIFDNALTSSYGSNHNKLMIVGTPKGVRSI